MKLLLPWIAGALCLLPLCASPVSFGRAEFDAALAKRGLHLLVKAELGDLPADAFKIELTRIRGGDLRGLMYGLLEAADQIRANGRLRPASGTPLNAIRGARMVLAAQGLPDASYWPVLFQMLARGRYNRFRLVFESVPEPAVLAPIAQAAAEYGIAFVLGVNQPVFEPLKAALAVSPVIRAIQIPAANDDATRAAAEAGRLVTVELRGSPSAPEEFELTQDADPAPAIEWGRRKYGDIHEDVVPRPAPARPAPVRPKAAGPK